MTRTQGFQISFKIALLPELEAWLANIKDGVTRRRLIRRLERAEEGAQGGVESVGEGVSEIRKHFGAGWRMYFVQRGELMIAMLGGVTGPRSSAILTRPLSWRKHLRAKSWLKFLNLNALMQLNTSTVSRRLLIT